MIDITQYANIKINSGDQGSLAPTEKKTRQYCVKTAKIVKNLFEKKINLSP